MPICGHRPAFQSRLNERHRAKKMAPHLIHNFRQLNKLYRYFLPKCFVRGPELFSDDVIRGFIDPAKGGPFKMFGATQRLEGLQSLSHQESSVR